MYVTVIHEDICLRAGVVMAASSAKIKVLMSESAVNVQYNHFTFPHQTEVQWCNAKYVHL